MHATALLAVFLCVVDAVLWAVFVRPAAAMFWIGAAVGVWIVDGGNK